MNSGCMNDGGDTVKRVSFSAVAAAAGLILVLVLAAVNLPEEKVVFAPAAEEASADDGAVYITGGERYHRKDCRYVNDDSGSMSRQAAEAAGYTPCGICKPWQN